MEEWCRRRALTPGARISLDRCWALARAWYPGEWLEYGWRGRSAEAAEAVFTSVGLAGPFWRMG